MNSLKIYFKQKRLKKIKKKIRKLHTIQFRLCKEIDEICSEMFAEGVALAEKNRHRSKEYLNKALTNAIELFIIKALP